MKEVSLKGHVLVFLILSETGVFTANKQVIEKYSDEDLKPFLEALGLEKSVGELEENEMLALAQQLECSQILAAYPSIDAASTNVEELLAKWVADNSVTESAPEVSEEVIEAASEIIEAVQENPETGVEIVASAPEEVQNFLIQFIQSTNNQSERMVNLMQKQGAIVEKQVEIFKEQHSLNTEAIALIAEGLKEKTALLQLAVSKWTPIVQSASALPQEAEA